MPAHGYAAVLGRRETLRAGSRTTTIQLTRHIMEKQHSVTAPIDRPILVGECYTPAVGPQAVTMIDNSLIEKINLAELIF